jgi:uncharacterized protein (TIGR04255 family)
MDLYQGVKYRKPPAVEVVCEFRFVPTEPWDLAIPGLVYNLLKDDFPRRRLLKTLESEAAAEAAGIRQQIRLAERMQFLREDEKAFVQVGPDLLAVNHLEPYPTWEEFVPLIHQGFDAYVAVTHPAGLRRIGLRYINRIKLPVAHVELADYFNYRPFVGPGLPQELSSLMVGIESSYNGDRDTLRLQLTTAKPESPDVMVVLLDLDYFLARPESVSLEGAFDWVEQAHARIQSAFEACLTDQLKEMFEPC